MRNAGMDEAQARIKVAGRNINNLRYADDTTLTAERNGNPLQYSCLENPMDRGGYSPRGHKGSDMIEWLHFNMISQEADNAVWYSHLLKNFPQFIVIHTVKGFGIINEAEVDVFLVFSCFFDDPTDVGTLISGSSAFSKTSLNIWEFMIHVLLKPGLENFEHCFASMWDECNCAVVWTFFGIAFLWDWNENWPFPVLWPLLSLPNAGILNAILSQHHLLGFEIAQLEFHHIH